MFGRNSDDDQQVDHDIQPVEGAGSNLGSDQSVNDHEASLSSTNQSWQHPGAPLPDSSAPTASSPVVAATPTVMPAATPHVDEDMPPKPVEDKPKEDKADDLIDLSSHELVEIKQKALGELNPLMDHLDQTPEEKFKTTMMMIQASDDQTLVKVAYEAAQKITDEKTRAQALLDIVNEINYFTNQQNSS